MEWYEYRMFNLKKRFNKKSAYPALHRNIIQVLLWNKEIKRTSRGMYKVIDKQSEVEQSNIEKPKTDDIGKLAEETWAKLSGKNFDPNSILDKDTIQRIKK